MNAEKLKRIADVAVAHGRMYGNNKLGQYSRAKVYLDSVSWPKLSSAEYDFIIKRIADRLEI